MKVPKSEAHNVAKSGNGSSATTPGQLHKDENQPTPGTCRVTSAHRDDDTVIFGHILKVVLHSSCTGAVFRSLMAKIFLEMWLVQVHYMLPYIHRVDYLSPLYMYVRHITVYL